MPRLRSVTPYKPEAGLTKQMRLHAQTGTIENELVYLPAAAEWLDEYLHELTTFPASKYDDQVDSTAQALHWIKTAAPKEPGMLAYIRMEAEKVRKGQQELEERVTGIGTLPVTPGRGEPDPMPSFGPQHFGR